MTLPTSFPDGATFGQTLGPAMGITEQADADAYFESLVQHLMRVAPNCTRQDAGEKVRQSLGYFAGYYSHETRVRVERLFRCEHPIFGSASLRVPSPAALKAGQVMVEGGIEAARESIQKARLEGT